MKLLHHRHTGVHHAHEHTSYTGLFALVIVVGVLLSGFTATALLAATPGPEMRSIGLGGVVPGKPPTVAATIDSPSSNTRFSSTPITVRGTCPKDTLVEIFKNDIFAGSTVCLDDGTYSLEIDLLIGKNTLVARVYDALNQEGPESKKIVVYFDISPAQANQFSPLSFGGEQLLLNTDAVFRGTFPEQSLVMPLDIIGGRPPFALNIQWGDGTNKVISRPTNQPFRVDHVYTQAGTFAISAQATDADGRVAFLSVAAIVNGQPYNDAAGAGATGPTDPTIWQRLLVVWPLYTTVLSVVISFWLGERREKRILIKRGAILPQ